MRESRSITTIGRKLQVSKRRFPDKVYDSYEELWEKEGYTEEFKEGPPPPKRPGER